MGGGGRTERGGWGDDCVKGERGRGVGAIERGCRGKGKDEETVDVEGVDFERARVMLRELERARVMRGSWF